MTLEDKIMQLVCDLFSQTGRHLLTDTHLISPFRCSCCSCECKPVCFLIEMRAEWWVVAKILLLLWCRVRISWCGVLSFLRTGEMWCQSSPWLYLLFAAQKDSEGERRVWTASSLHNTRCKQSTSFRSNNNNHSRLATWLLLWLGERIHAEDVC